MRGAIFDLDGTLADTSGDLLAAANAVLAPLGMPALDPISDRPVAGRGGRAMLRRSLEIADRPVDGTAETALVDQLYPQLLDVYGQALAKETRLFDGVVECLEALAADGWRLGVCTNKPEGLAVPLLDILGISRHFRAILGADSLAVRKPDPVHLTETARRIGAELGRSVMIGDTATDVATAQNAGVPCIVTRFGFAAGPVEELGADVIVDHFDEIGPVLNSLSPARQGA